MVVASKAHMERKGTRRKGLHLFFYCSAFLIFLHKTPTCAFGRPKQELASEFRERTGHSSRRKVKDVLGNTFSLSHEEKQLLTQISIASDRRSWQDVQSRFMTYSGKAPQIYNAAMNAALRCLRYDEGASIYQKCRERCERFEEATFTSALRIFAKLGKPGKVREIWDEAQKECALTHMLVASRIHAAAVEGDVTTAAAMLDLLDTKKLEINEIVLTSAIKSCWGWGTNQHRAAKYLWNLFAKFNVKPDVAAFAALMGAYRTAPLKDILLAKAEMEEMGIKPNKFFAESYLCSVVRLDFRQLNDSSSKIEALRKEPEDRLQAARVALEGFEAQRVKLTGLCKSVKRALQQLKQK